MACVHLAPSEVDKTASLPTIPCAPVPSALASEHRHEAHPDAKPMCTGKSLGCFQALREVGEPTPAKADEGVD